MMDPDAERTETSTEQTPKGKVPGWIRYVLYFGLIPLIVIGGIVIFRERWYLWISAAVLLVSMIPFFFVFEKSRISVYKLVLLSVMVALSVFGRIAFYWVPFFKPVTAMVIIAGTYMGMECGFMCGALSAILSNLYFGQGPWTPFQMLTWGMIGLGAALLANVFKKYRWSWLIYGLLAGLAYSMMMDVWTSLVTDGTLEASRYWFYFVSALPMTGIYMGSNLIFLLLLGYPIGKKLERMNLKYGL